MFARAALLLGLALCSAPLAGCTASWSSDQGKKISPKGSSYSYRVPHGWLIDHGEVSFSKNGRLYKTALNGQGGIGAIIVSQEEINVQVTSANVRAIESEFKRVAAAWTHPATGFHSRTLAGAPGLEYQIASQTTAGNPQLTAETVAFKGRRIFYVSCISSEEKQSEVASACDEVKGSLKLY